MHEYWLQFFTAALGVYGKGEAAEKAADEACAIYDKRVALAEQMKSDVIGDQYRDREARDEQVFSALPSFPPGVTLQDVRNRLNTNYDAINASLGRLLSNNRIFQTRVEPLTFYRKAV